MSHLDRGCHGHRDAIREVAVRQVEWGVDDVRDDRGHFPRLEALDTEVAKTLSGAIVVAHVADPRWVKCRGDSCHCSG